MDLDVEIAFCKLLLFVMGNSSFSETIGKISGNIQRKQRIKLFLFYFSMFSKYLH